MEAALFVYLASTLNNLKVFLCVSFVLSALVSFVFALKAEDGKKFKKGEKFVKSSLKKSKAFILLSTISAFMLVITPSEKTAYLAAGAYLGQKALTSEVSQDLQEIVALKVKQYKKELTQQVAGENK